MEELKNCPFCGCSDVSVYTEGTDTDNYYWVVECDGCGCTLEGFKTEEEAREDWNRRYQVGVRPKIIRPDGPWTVGQCDCSELVRTFMNFCPACGRKLMWP